MDNYTHVTVSETDVTNPEKRGMMMINRNDFTGKHLQKNGWRRLIALLSAMMLLMTSGGLSALAENPEIISDPVTAPVTDPNATPAPEEEPPPGEEGTEPGDEEPEGAEDEPTATPEPVDDTVYEAGSLSAEAEGCSVLVEYPAEARIPEGARLSFTAVKGADLYAAMKSASKLVRSDDSDGWAREIVDEGNTFYAVTLTNEEGEEIQPAAGLTLTYQNDNSPAGVQYFLTGENARALKLQGSSLRIDDYRMETFGYATVKRIQTGTVTLTYSAPDYIVTAAYGPEAGFPEGTDLKVREIRPGTPEYALYSGMTEEALSEEWSEITLERYFDITFVHDGNEMEPKAEVDVQILFRDTIELTDEHDVQAVHIENNEATVIESDTESNKAAKHDADAIDTVTFSSDSFSVYGVVQRTKITKKVLAADGRTYEINVTYGPEAQIPEGSEVRVEEIPEGSEVWEAYRKQTAAALNSDNVRLPGLYDISIVADGEKIEPQAQVNVSIRLVNADEGEELHVVHFTEELPQELISQDNAADFEPLAEEEKISSEKITASVEGDTVTFDTDSFSVYAFAYTVDFYYGEFEYHLTGGGTMTLSELFSLLNIDRNTADVVSVTFSDPSLVSVSKVEADTTVGALIDSLGLAPNYSTTTTEEEQEAFRARELKANDWALISLQRFLSHESLTIRFSNGDTIVIQVEDATEYAYNAVVSGRYNNQIPGLLWMYSGDTRSETYSGTTSNSKLALPLKVEIQNGYRFAAWVTDTGENAPYYDNTSEWLNKALSDKFALTRDTTFICYLVPNGQYLIQYEAGAHGRIDNADRYITDRYGVNHYYSYSGDWRYAHATADENYYLEGWYQGSTFLTADEWLNLSDISGDTVVTAKFKERSKVTINYKSTWYYTNIKIGEYGPTAYAGGPDGAVVSETSYTDQVQGATASCHGTGSNYSNFLCWIDADGRHVSNNAKFVPTGDQIKDTTYTAVFTAASDYVMIECDYHSGTVGGTSGLYTGDLDLESANTASNIVFARYDGSGNLLGNLWPIPNEGYVFDHWEWRPASGGMTTITDETIYANDSRIKGRGTLKAVFKPHITYDIGEMNRVGINSADSQRWYSASWCPKPSVNNATATQDENIYVQSINYNSTLTLPSLSRETRVSQTTNGYNLLTHTFTGWKTDHDVTLSNGQVISAGSVIPAGSKINNVTEGLHFTAVWSSTFPGKAVYNGGKETGPRYNTNTVGFFVRLFDSVFDRGNTNTYTDCLFTTRLTGAPIFDGNGSRVDFYGNSVATDKDEIDSIDQYIRDHATGGISSQLSGNYSGSVLKLDAFPSDDLIFSRIRAWNANAPQSKKIQISGHDIQQSMLTSDYFEIRWYVLKDQENSWHIDGMLIPKYAKLVVKKSFIGADEALTGAESGYQIVVTEQGAENPDTWTLNLTQGSTDGVTVTFDAEHHEYMWELDKLIPLKSYLVTEQNYQPGSGFTTTISYKITNTSQTSGTSGNTASATVDEVTSYADGTDASSIQTVAFTNLYTKPYVMTILKQDGTTLHGLKNVTFDYKLLQGSSVILSGERKSNENGQITVDFPHSEGVYTFTLTEHPHEGYNAISKITGTATVASNGAVTLYPVNAEVSGDDVLVIVDGTDKSIVYVKNMPERKRVTVSKYWTDGTNTPVTIQLLRNGVPVQGKSVVLGASSANASADPIRVTGWTHTWEELPAYVDGSEVYYSVREEWIGEPGGVDSVRYNWWNDSTDGYADYIVNQTQTESIDGSDTVITVYLENTPDHGQIRFTKEDANGKALKGATFTLYQDSGNQTGPKQPLTAVGTYTSDDNGIVLISGLSNGWYWLRETGAPTGYVPDGDWYAVQIKDRNSTIYTCDQSNYNVTWTKVTRIKNDPFTATVKIHKQNEAGTALQGAVFSLHLSDGDSMVTDPVPGKDQLTTDASGEVSIPDLLVGTYYLVEDTAPEGYRKPDDPIKLVISQDAPTVTATVDNKALPVSGENVITVNNEPEGRIVKLRKQDRSSKANLEGVRFQIYDGDPNAGGTLINFSSNTEWWSEYAAEMGVPLDEGTTLVSDSLGRFYYGYLPSGTYYVRETLPKEGYYRPADYILEISTSGVTLAEEPYTSPAVYPIDTKTNTFHNVYFFNDLIPTTSLTVEKIWDDGAEKHTEDEITINLIRYAKLPAEEPENQEPGGQEPGGTEEPPVVTDGTLNITHNMSGEGLSGSAEGFTYTATDVSNASNTYTFSSKTGNTLPAGTYRITVSGGSTPGGYTYSGTAEQQVTITAGGTAGVTLTSNYEKIPTQPSAVNVNVTAFHVQTPNVSWNRDNHFTGTFTQGTTIRITYTSQDYSSDVYVNGTKITSFSGAGTHTCTYTITSAADVVIEVTDPWYPGGMIGNISVTLDSSSTQMTGTGGGAEALPEGYDEGTVIETVTLSGALGWSHEFTELPTEDENGDPVYYDIQEITVPGYTTTYLHDGPVMATTTAIQLTAKNTPDAPTTGGLTVSKTVAGNACDTELPFDFTVTLSDTTLTGEYGEMTFTEGVATFQLTDGQSLTANNLPGGITYTVEETPVEDYVTEVEDNTGTIVTGTIVTGTIVAGETQSAAFTNTKDIEPGSLTLQKLVTGEQADEEKDFTFTITILTTDEETGEDVQDSAFTGVHGDAEFTGGFATILLHHEQMATISDMPYNTRYVIAEAEEDPALYAASVTYNGAADTLPLDKTITGTENVAIVVTNTRIPTVDVDATKAWGETPQPLTATAVQFTLWRQVGAAGTPEAIDTAIATESTEWKVSWTDLYQFADAEQTQEYVYTVTETGVYFGDPEDTDALEAYTWNTDLLTAIYNTESSGTDNHYLFTNTPKLTEIQADKSWMPGFTDPGDTWEAEFILKSDRSAEPLTGYRLKSEETANPERTSLVITDESTAEERTITDLPKYVISDGTAVPVTYSLQEVRYEVRHNGEVIYAYDGANYTGDPYTPAYQPSTDENGKTTIQITNSRHTSQFTVYKEWIHILNPNEMPTVHFTLMQYTVGNSGSAHVYTDASGKAYNDLELSAANGWKWECPTLPDDDGQGHAYAYYVVENKDGSGKVDFDKSTIPAELRNARYIEEDSYESSQGHVTEKTEQVGHPEQAYIEGGTGSITIRNRAPGGYMQMDLKKKFLAMREDGALDTVTGYDYQMRDLVIEVRLYRRSVKDEQITVSGYGTSDTIVEKEPWAPYGDRILIGYNSNGQHVEDKGSNPFAVEYAGSWHWTIEKSNHLRGLPKYGYYYNGSSYESVRYEYVLVETNAYKNLAGDPLDDGYEWYAVLPAVWEAYGQIIMFPQRIAQDQDRLMNVMATNLQITKDWKEARPAADKIYVKVFRLDDQNYNAGQVEDFTEKINHPIVTWQGGSGLSIPNDGNCSAVETLTSNGETYIVLSADNNWTTMITGVRTSGKTHTYRYWIQEMGYQVGGVDYFDPDTQFNPKYAIVSGTEASYSNKPTGGPAIILGRKGTNHLKVSNTVQDTSITVQKKWMEDGEESHNWPTGIASVQVGLMRKVEGDAEFTDVTEGGAIVQGSITDGTDAVFDGLPLYEGDKPITYGVRELGVTLTDGSEVSVSGMSLTITGEHAASWSVVNGEVSEENIAVVTNSKVKTDIHIQKTKDDMTSALTGAEFKLEKLTGSDPESDADYTVVEGYGTLAVNADGAAPITGLTDGTYRLTETKAPAGYIAISEKIRFTVSNGNVQYTNVEGGLVKYEKAAGAAAGTFTVGNKSGSLLPETGSSGTLAYTLAGFALILLAAFLLIRKTRKNRS